MRDLAALRFGGFLVGLGLGWYIFGSFDITLSIFAWILMILGVGIVISALISWLRPNLHVRGLAGGLIGGLILSLFLTGGLALVQSAYSGGVSWIYRAEGTKTYSGIVTEGKVYLEVDNFNGFIRVSTWDRPEYRIDLKIRAAGSSQKNAEDNLASLKVNLDERSDQGQKRLALSYDVPFLAYSRYSIEVEAVLPSNTVIGLDLESTNGGIFLNDIKGDVLKASTSNGPLSFRNIHTESLTGKTSNGNVDGSVDAKNTILSTSNGGVSLKILCTVSGKYDLGTSNGILDLKVSQSLQVGYSLVLSTSNANININLQNLEYSLNERTAKKAQTIGFSSKAVQLSIRGSTSNGNIVVDTSRDSQPS